MRTLATSFVAIALVGFAAGVADAQCAFDGPAKARGMNTSLVRAYTPCTGTITFPAPNSQTGTNVPSCAPPWPHSNFLFDYHSGTCSFKTTATLESPCRVGAGDCMNMRIQVKCSGITASDTETKIDGLEEFGAGWTVSMVASMTLDDRDNGDMTVALFPFQLGFGLARRGKLNLRTDTNAMLIGLGLDPLPACTQFDIVSFAVLDPSGYPFATMGAGTRPKGP